MKIFHFSMFLLFTVFLVIGSTRGLHAQNKYTVQGKITELTGDANVYVSLQNKKEWKSKSDDDVTVGIILEASQVSADGSIDFSMQASAGKYLVSFFEDIDGNKKITMGFFGPKEPYGFYRVFKSKLRKPKFKEVFFELNKDMKLGSFPILKSKRKKS